MQMKSWENKRILVTGSGGFIGSHSTSLLLPSAKEVGYGRYGDRGMQ